MQFVLKLSQQYENTIRNSGFFILLNIGKYIFSLLFRFSYTESTEYKILSTDNLSKKSFCPKMYHQ